MSDSPCLFSFSEKTPNIDQWISARAPCMTDGLYDRTLSELTASLSETATLSSSRTRCFLSKNLPFTLPLFLLPLSHIENFIRATRDGSLSCLRAREAASACQTKHFQKSQGIIRMSGCSCLHGWGFLLFLVRWSVPLPPSCMLFNPSISNAEFPVGCLDGSMFNAQAGPI